MYIIYTCILHIISGAGWALAEVALPQARFPLHSFPIFPVISGKHLSSHSSSGIAMSRAQPACASQHRSAVAGLHLAFKDLLKINEASRASLVDQV